MAVVIIFLMTTTVARVFYLTIVRGEELSEKAETQQLKDTEITAMRGTIYDSNGKENKKLSQRVEFRVRTNADARISQILKTVQK